MYFLEYLNGYYDYLKDNNYNLTVRENINKTFVGDLSMSQTSNKTTGADTLAATRTEAGITGSTSMFGVTPYVRTAVGQKFSSATNFTYYSVEPGVAVPFASTISPSATAALDNVTRIR